MSPHRSGTGLLVASNRLPVLLAGSEDGGWRTERGSGGLITALLPVLRNRGGTWVGWAGAGEDSAPARAAIAAATGASGYELEPIFLSEEERAKFYHGFCNEIIWPLFHDFQSLCNFDPGYWETYQAVNGRFADALCRISGPESFVWVHDYHLITVAAAMRARGSRAKIAYFLHIPFPPLDVFEKLPWRIPLMRALLEYDLLGFQTMRDQRNFVHCARSLIRDLSVRDKGRVRTLGVAGGRPVRVGCFPIGIDSEGIARRAASADVAQRAAELRRLLPNRQLILGVDRLDYTKGIPLRLRAFGNALERYEELHERVTLIQAVVPSREDIPQYQELKMAIERLVGEINGRFTRPGGWVPIHYVYRSLDYADLLACYRAAEIALITPLKDGMNLVAKEYCASSIEEDCVLILSEFAGAAAQLQRGAILVNPYDIVGVADAIREAYLMNRDQRRARMRRLRRVVWEQNIFRWVDSFLYAAIEKDLSAFPVPEECARQETLHEDPAL
jgi:trehalose 6-phosphate synthase